MTPFIVAEMSANHLGSLTRALEIVDAAADAGADAVKVQTWTPGRMVLDKTIVLDHGPWAGQRLVDLYEQAFLPWEWHKAIFDRARERGLIPFSAAFDRGAVDFLETLGVDRHKVASFELVDLPLIRYMASKGKPMILSTGMATFEEVARAWHEARRLAPTATILKCTSAYPADLSQCNLLTLRNWCTNNWATTYAGAAPQFGLSDHTMGHDAAVVATVLGATMIEKHLTLSRSHGGPDAWFSAEPAEFAAMVQAVRRAAQTLGKVEFGPQPGEDPGLRRSLWVLRDISEGEALRLDDNVVTARPAHGLPPSTSIDGRRAARALSAGTPLMAGDLA